VKDLSYRVVPVVAVLPAASTNLAGVIVRLASDNRPYWCDGTTWFDVLLAVGSDPRVTTARITADVINSTTTLANATGLAISMDANTTYGISARVLFQTAAPQTGIRLTQTAPTGATVFAQWNTPTSLTANTVSNQRAIDSGTATSGIDTANTTTLASAEIVVVNGATAGSLQIRFASEVAASNAVLKVGSHVVAHKIV